MRWHFPMIIVLTLQLIGCSTLPDKSPQRSSSSQEPESKLSQIIGEGPEIPFNREDAFYPLRENPTTGNIVPSYSWRECTKRIIVCMKWTPKIVYFEDMSWFQANDFGLTKRQRPK